MRLADRNAPTRLCGRLVFVMALVSALLGCRPGRQLIASPDDYSDYRKTRIAESLDERLTFAHQYLRDHPAGSFRPEVERYFSYAEPIFYAAKRETKSGLIAYLAALPGGPHAEEAARRLVAIRERDNQPDTLGLAATATKERLERASQQRKEARRGVSKWLAHFLDASVFEQPLALAPRELVVDWGLLLPKPICAPLPDAGKQCSKILTFPYIVPVKGGLLAAGEREMVLEIMLTESSEGTPTNVVLAGPDLFLRIEETVVVKPRKPGLSAHRINAVVTSVELARTVFEETVSKAPECQQPVVAPEVLHLSCNGLSMRLRSGAAPGDDDALIIAPSASEAIEPPVEPSSDEPMDAKDPLAP